MKRSMLRWWPPNWLYLCAVAHDLEVPRTTVFRVINKRSGKGAYLPNTIFLGFGELDCMIYDICEIRLTEEKES
jgi:hypothetical protein